jgi:hypothetical protein
MVGFLGSVKRREVGRVRDARFSAAGAQAHTEFNAYWGGELDMVVPVQYLR